MTSIGLVLSAGGMHAAAFHAGVLAAVSDATGWDPRTADVMVGTSAGASTAISLRAGLTATDLAANCTGAPLSSEGQEIAGRVTTRLDIPPPTDRTGSWWPANPMLLIREILSPKRPRPVVAIAGVLPEGTVSGVTIAERADQVHPGPWPRDATWICAVDLDSGKRVVFGRDDVDAGIGEAVQASSAVPGHLTPVAIDGDRYVDGGSHSTTNADLLSTLGLDLVVVSSSMTAVPSASARPDGPLGRAWHSRTLRREVEAIRSRSTPVLVVQPTAIDLEIRSGGDMDRSSMADICGGAALSARACLAHPRSTTARGLLERAAQGAPR